MRLKSWSENSQRALIQRVDSNVRPIISPTARNPVCQPQKASAAPSNKGGVFIKAWSFQSCQCLLDLAHFQNMETVGLILHGSKAKYFVFSRPDKDQHQQGNPQ